MVNARVDLALAHQIGRDSWCAAFFPSSPMLQTNADGPFRADSVYAEHTNSCCHSEPSPETRYAYRQALLVSRYSKAPAKKATGQVTNSPSPTLRYWGRGRVSARKGE